MESYKSRASPERLLLLSAAGALAIVFVWYQWRLLLLAFAGLLVSTLLHAVATWVERRTPLSSFPAYALTLLIIVAAVAGIAVLLLPHVVTQISEAVVELPALLARAETYLEKYAWGRDVLRLLISAWQGTGSHLTMAAENVVNAGVDLIVVLVIGFFGALNPKRYRNGLLAMVPEQYRARASALTEDVLHTLRSWILGQMVPMVVLGLVSMIGLWLLGVPLAFTTGLLTGALIFMPYIGSVSSGLFAIVLGLQQSVHTAVYVFFLYVGVHLLEGYLLTPFVQRRAVRLPPVLTILTQLCFWSFGGVLGVAVAAPVAAAGFTALRTLYLQPRGSVHAETPARLG